MPLSALLYFYSLMEDMTNITDSSSMVKSFKAAVLSTGKQCRVISILPVQPFNCKKGSVVSHTVPLCFYSTKVVKWHGYDKSTDRKYGVTVTAVLIVRGRSVWPILHSTTRWLYKFIWARHIIGNLKILI